ncbi:Holliday junction resolvase RuvX [Aciditerrimonas ferrireducens]|uniref:Holliday junction resolvase RuvX n=1 Tax=Aciditerrimonas ferrireducens TaxID=667306 RepID=UPI002003FAA2|nr:Holliday junction resolvase RuvX [Aciditerrimonas ferrireducens]MCK4177201.1 Holliday junction resolvase RuvX [Aciditerrimonas ferrireducens]
MSGERPGRALGLDLGARRVGVAVSDSAGRLALPWGTLPGDQGDEALAAAVGSLAEELGVRTIVVGVPRSLDGREGPAAVAARTRIADLAERLAARHLTVTTQDERLTTVSASRALRAAGVGGRRQRARVDAAAATELLQGWLDARQGPRSVDEDQGEP